MTATVNLGDTMDYSSDLMTWAGTYNDAGRNRLTEMLGKMTLAMLSKQKQGDAAECRAHPTNTKRNVLHFRLTDSNWYCFTVESTDAEIEDTNTKLRFTLRDSTGSSGARNPGSQVVAQLDSGMSAHDIANLMP